MTEGVRFAHVLGRTKPGVSEAQAEADLRPIVEDLKQLEPRAFPETHAIRARLVDEYRVLVVPTILGGGKRVLPSDVYAKLDLLDERRFSNAMIYVRYRTLA